MRVRAESSHFSPVIVPLYQNEFGYDLPGDRHSGLLLWKPLLFTVTGVILVLLLVIATAFVRAHRARAKAEGYLRVIVPLRIDSTYDVVVKQLQDADILTTLPRDCHHECVIELRFSNDLQAMLHLAPPIGFLGDLDFADGKLVHKGTSLGGPNYAAVTEDSSTVSEVKVHQYKIWVALSPSDFTDYRRQAYAFNLACIGSMRGCKMDELLPTINSLEHGASK